MKEKLVLSVCDRDEEHTIIGFLVDKDSFDDAVKLGDELFDDSESGFIYQYGADVTYRPAADDIDDYCEESPEYQERREILEIRSLIKHPKIKDCEYKLLTRSNLSRMFTLDFDGDAVFVKGFDKILSGRPELKPYVSDYQDAGFYRTRNKKFDGMKSLDRDGFSKLFSTLIASDWKTFERFEDAVHSGGMTAIEGFRIWQEEEELYILHMQSGIMVGWYKLYHYGRDNFVNRKDFTLSDLRDFFLLLRHQIRKTPDEGDLLEDSITTNVKEEVSEESYKKAAAKLMRNTTYGMGDPGTTIIRDGNIVGTSGYAKAASDITSAYPSIFPKKKNKQEDDNNG